MHGWASPVTGKSGNKASAKAPQGGPVVMVVCGTSAPVKYLPAWFSWKSLYWIAPPLRRPGPLGAGAHDILGNGTGVAMHFHAGCNGGIEAQNFRIVRGFHRAFFLPDRCPVPRGLASGVSVYPGPYPQQPGKQISDRFRPGFLTTEQSLPPAAITRNSSGGPPPRPACWQHRTARTNNHRTSSGGPA